jgi:uncharacterized membrane protein
MECAVCGSSTKVTQCKHGTLQVVRRRKCLNPECGVVATTVEYYQSYSPIDIRVKISKLSVEDVADIKTMLIEGKKTYKKIAEIYDVSVPLIHKIATGKSWPMVRPSCLPTRPTPEN